MISLTNVTKGYCGRNVLHDINLTVEEGDFVTIIGYSGTGKTTLISLLAGLITPDSGTVLMNGNPVMEPDHERGLVFQNYSLLPWLTVAENIRLAVDERFPEWSRAERAGQVAKYVAMVKLTPAAGKYPSELSGGMRQRVSVARALAMEPKVLLLDEPLSALDALTRAQLQDEIGEIWLRDRTTLVWITNDPDEALLVADRVIPLVPCPGAGATLAPEIEVELPRPRDRRAMGHDDTFRALRRGLISTMVEARTSMNHTPAKPLLLPDLLPEDLMTPDTLRRLNRKGPLRRADAIANAEVAS